MTWLKEKIMRLILFVLGIILGLLVLYHLYLSYQPEINLLIHFNTKNEQLLIKLVRSHGSEDLFFLFTLIVVCVAIPGLSNGIFSVLNGVLYGPKIGFIINWISDILGQIILLYLLQKLYNPEKLKKSKIYDLLQSQSYPQLTLIIGYVIPFIPSATVAYVNALINKTKKKRLIPILIGTAPFAFLYAYGGDSILHLNKNRLITTVIGIAVIIVLAVLILFIIKKIRDHKKKEA